MMDGLKTIKLKLYFFVLEDSLKMAFQFPKYVRIWYFSGILFYDLYFVVFY
jgi:hypothetical protein